MDVCILVAMKYFIGPVSRNTVDACIEYTNEYTSEIVFIPSRRQIDYTGGYVNNWTTEEFSKYVRASSKKHILIERDHSGPNQGSNEDDGFESLKADCAYFDIIHLDPWKKYKEYSSGFQWTLDMIQFCYAENPNLWFEIGTEEAIRPFTTLELDTFLTDIKTHLPSQIVSRIKYVVIQCGTRLQAAANVGTYNCQKLQEMVQIVSNHGFTAKEHNGDWVSNEVLQSKARNGLSNLNIAPEFGEIETQVILEHLTKEDFERFFELCYQSNTWVKWVAESFEPLNEREKLVRICGHYLYSHPTFLDIKSRYPTIDSAIKKAIRNKLHRLNNIYYERPSCIMCKGTTFTSYFETDYYTPMSYCFDKDPVSSYFIPYNILLCSSCKTVQTKYLGNPSIIYEKTHADGFGTLKQSMYTLFSNFVSDTTDISGIIEVGASMDYLSRSILNKIKTSYTVIEPNFQSTNTTLTIIPKLFDDVNLCELSGNTLVMSHLFEHLYDPVGALEKIQKSNIKYIYLNHPNLENDCKSNTYIILNIEHIYYVENTFLIELFDKYGFELVKRSDYNTHSIFLKFQRKLNDTITERLLLNKTSEADTLVYFNTMLRKIDKLNTLFQSKDRKFYLWPSATYIVSLFVNGLNTTHLTGLLDNSPNKIGKILYGYNIPCYDFKEVFYSNDPTTTIILGGSSGYRNELDLTKTKVEVLFLDDI